MPDTAVHPFMSEAISHTCASLLQRILAEGWWREMTQNAVTGVPLREVHPGAAVALCVSIARYQQFRANTVALCAMTIHWGGSREEMST